MRGPRRTITFYSGGQPSRVDQPGAADGPLEVKATAIGAAAMIRVLLLAIEDVGYAAASMMALGLCDLLFLSGRRDAGSFSFAVGNG
jgi:hypothetical protein